MSDDDKFRAVCKEVFGVELDITMEEGAKLFSQGMVLPKPRKSVGGETVYSSIDLPQYISFDEFGKMLSEEKIMLPHEKVSSVSDIKKLCKGIDTFLGSKFINSKNVEKSDNVLGSNNVFMSEDILSSKFIGFSHSLNGCEYVYGSRQCSDSSFCIRIQDSKLLSNCFETSWSAKCSNLLFCHDCFDLRDSMFCYHAASRQYCIANRQYTEQEYAKARKLIIDHLLKNKFKVDFFPVL
jgi:hypothetical protein